MLRRVLGADGRELVLELADVLVDREAVIAAPDHREAGRPLPLGRLDVLGDELHRLLRLSAGGSRTIAG